MNLKKSSESLSNLIDNTGDHQSSVESANRRSALQKIGKFSAYAAPTAIALLSSKAAHAS